MYFHFRSIVDTLLFSLDDTFHHDVLNGSPKSSVVSPSFAAKSNIQVRMTTIGTTSKSSALDHVSKMGTKVGSPKSSVLPSLGTKSDIHVETTAIETSKISTTKKKCRLGVEKILILSLLYYTCT